MIVTEKFGSDEITHAYTQKISIMPRFADEILTFINTFNSTLIRADEAIMRAKGVLPLTGSQMYKDTEDKILLTAALFNSQRLQFEFNDWLRLEKPAKEFYNLPQVGFVARSLTNRLNISNSHVDLKSLLTAMSRASMRMGGTRVAAGPGEISFEETPGMLASVNHTLPGKTIPLEQYFRVKFLKDAIMANDIYSNILALGNAQMSLAMFSAYDHDGYVKLRKEVVDKISQFNFGAVYSISNEANGAILLNDKNLMSIIKAYDIPSFSKNSTSKAQPVTVLSMLSNQYLMDETFRKSPVGSLIGRIYDDRVISPLYIGGKSEFLKNQVAWDPTGALAFNPDNIKFYVKDKLNSLSNGKELNIPVAFGYLYYRINGESHSMSMNKAGAVASVTDHHTCTLLDELVTFFAQLNHIKMFYCMGTTAIDGISNPLMELCTPKRYLDATSLDLIKSLMRFMTCFEISEKYAIGFLISVITSAIEEETIDDEERYTTFRSIERKSYRTATTFFSTFRSAGNGSLFPTFLLATGKKMFTIIDEFNTMSNPPIDCAVHRSQHEDVAFYFASRCHILVTTLINIGKEILRDATELSLGIRDVAIFNSKYTRETLIALAAEYATGTYSYLSRPIDYWDSVQPCSNHLGNVFVLNELNKNGRKLFMAPSELVKLATAFKQNGVIGATKEERTSWVTHNVPLQVLHILAKFSTIAKPKNRSIIHDGFFIFGTSQLIDQKGKPYLPLTFTSLESYPATPKGEIYIKDLDVLVQQFPYYVATSTIPIQNETYADQQRKTSGSSGYEMIPVDDRKTMLQFYYDGADYLLKDFFPSEKEFNLELLARTGLSAFYQFAQSLILEYSSHHLFSDLLTGVVDLKRTSYELNAKSDFFVRQPNYAKLVGVNHEYSPVYESWPTEVFINEILIPVGEPVTDVLFNGLTKAHFKPEDGAICPPFTIQLSHTNITELIKFQILETLIDKQSLPPIVKADKLESSDDKSSGSSDFVRGKEVKPLAETELSKPESKVPVANEEIKSPVAKEESTEKPIDDATKPNENVESANDKVEGKEDSDDYKSKGKK